MLDGEKDIVSRAICGESAAFGLLYDHYQPQIYRFIILKVGHREEAEDITHHVFIAAWKSVGEYEDIGHPFSSWLYRIARNQVIDYYRTKKSNVGLDSKDVESVTADSNTESLVAGKMELELVAQAIEKLPQEYQDIIIMRFVEELSVRETASALQKSEGAVKVMQHRAVKELKKLLGET